ncbi:MAG: hypothetical protein A2Y73_06270 [Chloroflexi bacterium RBG_13_56_8]|nr:MAG: hypothetical protein A2Y73_06270 [Chloroflexi bacterium RBG_13_56_8]
MREMHLLGSILNDLSDGIVVLDSQGRVAYYNPALAHILGAEVSDIVGQKVSNDSDIEGLRRLASLLGDDLHKAGQGYERHVEMEKPIHATLYIAVSPLLDQEGDWERLIVLRDRTEDWETIQERAGFLGTASRALRSPLESIRGYATLLMSHRALEPQVEDWVLRIREQSSRLIRFAEDLADLCAMDEKELPVQPHPISVEDLLSDVVNASRQVAQRREVSLEMHCPPDLPPLPLDQHLVRRALLNLIENAIYRSVRNGNILLRAEANLEELTITLADDGMPLPAETRAQVFGGSYRAHGERVQGPIDAGLGLYISRKLIEAHGGHLWMPEDESGQVRFRFILPLQSSSESGQIT